MKIMETYAMYKKIFIIMVRYTIFVIINFFTFFITYEQTNLLTDFILRCANIISLLVMYNFGWNLNWLWIKKSIYARGYNIHFIFQKVFDDVDRHQSELSKYSIDRAVLQIQTFDISADEVWYDEFIL